MYLASLAPSSRPATISSLRRVVEVLGGGRDVLGYPWHALRAVQTLAIRTWLAEHFAPSTCNRVLAALRGILRYCYSLELMSQRDYEHARRLPVVRGSRPLAGRALSDGDLRALFGVCDRALVYGARNGALLALLYGAGLRRCEVCGLDFGDLHPEEADPKVHAPRRPAHLRREPPRCRRGSFIVVLDANVLFPFTLLRAAAAETLDEMASNLV